MKNLNENSIDHIDQMLNDIYLTDPDSINQDDHSNDQFEDIQEIKSILNIK